MAGNDEAQEPQPALNQKLANIDRSKDPPPLPATAKAVKGPDISQIGEIIPTYEDVQTEAQMESVLSDGKPHVISILFKDEFSVRAKQKDAASGRIKELTSLANHDLKGVNAVISGPDVSLRPLYTSTETTPETELRAEQDRVLREHGYTPPNQASWVTATLEPFNKDRAKALVRKLQGMPQVRTVSIPPSLRLTASAHTAPPSTEPKFPSNWQANEFTNTQTYMDNNNVTGGVQWWWWNRHSIGAAWQYGKGSGVKVAVIDSCFSTDVNDGVQYNTIQKRRYYEDGSWSVGVDPDGGSSPLNVTGDNDTNGSNFYHGSAVASLIGASDTNETGMCGIAPGVSIVPLRTTSHAPSIVNAIAYANQIGAKMVNMSRAPIDAAYGYNPENDATYRYAIRSVYDAGGTFVISSGNTSNRMELPSQSSYFSYAIFVGGIDRENNYYKSGSSGEGTNYGPRVDIAAAGQNMTVPVNYLLEGDSFTVANAVILEKGTSFAAPLVAGAAALVRQYASHPAIVRDILIGTADIMPSVNGNTVAYTQTSSTTTMSITSNGAYDSVRWMSSNRDNTQSHMNGSEGWGKIRVLNAFAAAKVAVKYASGNTYIVYRPASDEYTHNKRVSPTPVTADEGWYPLNFFTTYSPTATVEAWAWQQPSLYWASASTVYKHGRIQAYEVMGSGTTRNNTNNVLQNIWTSRGGAPSGSNGWVDGTSYVLN